MNAAKRTILTIVAASALLTRAYGQGSALDPNADWHGLQCNDFKWQRGDLFRDLCTGQITFTNGGTEAIGNIHYRTFYISETGIRHENSIIDAVIEKLIQPGETRTIELEKFLVPVDCTIAGIHCTSCEVLPAFTKVAPHAEPAPTATGKITVYNDAASWRRDHPPTQEEIDAEKKLQAVWNKLTPTQRANLKADELR